MGRRRNMVWRDEMKREILNSKYEILNKAKLNSALFSLAFLILLFFLQILPYTLLGDEVFEVTYADIRGPRLKIILNEPINPATLTDDSLYLLGEKGKVEKEIKIKGDGREIHIRLRKRNILAFIKPFVLVMTPEIKSSSGASLKKGYIKVFNVWEISPLDQIPSTPGGEGAKRWWRIINVSENPHIEIKARRFWWGWFPHKGEIEKEELGEEELEEDEKEELHELKKERAIEEIKLLSKLKSEEEIKNYFHHKKRPPIIEISGIKDGELTNKDVMIDIKVTDPDKDLSFAYPFLNFLLYPNKSLITSSGDYWLFVIAVDKGKRFAYQFLRFTIDKIPPEFISLNPSQDLSTNEPQLTITGEVKGADGLRINNFEVSLQEGKFAYTLNLQVGANPIKIIAYDKAGNITERSFTVNYISDNSPPIITVKSPLDSSYLNTPKISVSGIVEDQSEILYVRVNGIPAKLTGSEFLLPELLLYEGLNKIIIESEDSFGNKSSISISVILDTTLPSLQLISPEPNSYIKEKSVLVKGTVSDEYPVRVKINGIDVQAQNSFFESTLELQEGKNEINIVAEDLAGNQSTLILTITVDTIPPVINVSTPKEGEIFSLSFIPVNGRINDENPYKIKINGSEGEVIGKNFYFDNLPLNEGENQIRIIAEDRAGNIAEESLTVILDKTPPQITILSPVDGSLLSQRSVLVKGNVSEASETEVKVNEIKASIVGQEFSALVPLKEGFNIIRATAKDRAGNVSEASVSVNVDTLPPVLSIISPADGSILSTPTVEVSGRVDDENLLDVKINGKNAKIENGEYSLTITLTEGSNTIEVLAEDRAGQKNSLSINVYLDTKRPEIISVIPPKNSKNVPLQTNIEVEFSEPISPSSLNPGSFYILRQNGEKIEGSISLENICLSSGEGAKGVFTPYNQLPDSEILTLYITSGVKDLAGNFLLNPYQGSFETMDITPPLPPSLDPVPEKTSLRYIAISGFSEPGSKIVIEGGLLRKEGSSDERGRFFIEVPLKENQLNHISVYSVDLSGNESLPSQVSIYHESSAFVVTGAEFIGNQIKIYFSRVINPQTLNSSSLSVQSSRGKEEGEVGVSGEGDIGIFQPSSDLTQTPFLLEVSTSVKDREGNPLSYPFTKMFNHKQGQTIIQGEVYDDSTGLPLEGVTVKVINVNGSPPQPPEIKTLPSKEGKYVLLLPAERCVVRAEKEGWTKSDRIILTASGFSSEVFDSRIAPLNPETWTLNPEGGVIEIPSTLRGEVVLIYPGGAVDSQKPIKITLLSPQAPQGRLPIGWSPLVIIDIVPFTLGGGQSEGTFLKPCTLRFKNKWNFPAEKRLVLARWDENDFKWKAESFASITEEYINCTISKLGNFALLIKDIAPIEPSEPAIGEQIPSVQASSIGNLIFSPSTIYPHEMSLGSLKITPEQPISSGVPVQAKITERYQLLTGTTVLYPTYTADLTSYNFGGNQSVVEFFLSPNKEISISDLKIGAIEADMVKYTSPSMAVVIGPDGGTVTGEGGAEITIEPGSVEYPIPVSLRAKDEQSLPIPISSDFRFLGAVELSFGGFSLKKQAILSVLLRDDILKSLPPDAQFITCRLKKIDTDYFWVETQTSYIDGNRLKTHNSNNAFLPFPGVREGGLYIFLQILRPAGYAKGTVYDSSSPSNEEGVILSVNHHNLKSLTSPGGPYAQIAFFGEFELTATNRISKDEGKAKSSIQAQGEIKNIDIQIQPVGPRVIAVNPPDGATDVPLESKIEVIFSEPVKASTINQNNFYLSYVNQKISGTYKISPDGRKVEFLPSKPLPSDTQIFFTIATGIQDLSSNPMESIFQSSFRTKDIIPPQTDLSLISVLIPQNGISRVIGKPGAVEPGATVIVINDRTGKAVTVSGLSDGSFELTIEALLSDKLIIKVIDNSGNETSLERPFVSEDGKSIVFGSKASEFINSEGIGIKIEEGTFTGAVVVRIEEEKNLNFLAPAPEGYQRLKAVNVDFSGRNPAKPFKLSIPSTLGSQDAQIFVAKELFLLGQRKLMIVESASLKDGRIEVNSPPFPGLLSSGTYSFLFTTTPLGFLSFSVAQLGLAYFAWEFAYLSDYSSVQKIYVPVPLNREITLKVKDLTTGETLFEGKTAGPTIPSQIYEFRENLTKDFEAPFLLNTIGINSLSVEITTSTISSRGIKISGTDSNGDGIHDGDSIKVIGESGATIPGGRIRIYNLTKKKEHPAVIIANEDGSFEANVGAEFKDRILIITEKRNVPLNQEFIFSFSEPISSDSVNNENIKLYAISSSTQEEMVVPGRAKLLSQTDVSFKPEILLKEGTHYILEIRGIKDLSGNEFMPLKADFKTKKSSSADMEETGGVYQTIKKGSYLFVSAGENGLKVLDVSNPSDIKTIANLRFSDRVNGLSLYGESKLIIVGGGAIDPGFLRIIDISNPSNPVETKYLGISYRIGSDPEVFKDLPIGYPRKVKVLGNYAFVSVYGLTGALEVIDLLKAEGGEGRKSIIGMFRGEGIDEIEVFSDREPGTGADVTRAVLLMDYYGLKILNLSQPAIPREEGVFQIPVRKHLSGLSVALSYPVDLDRDGNLGEEEDRDSDPVLSSEEKKDLAFFSIQSQQEILIIDITNRANPIYLGSIKLSTTSIGEIYLSKESRTLYVNAGKLFLIDMNEPTGFGSVMDRDGDGMDDRIVGIISTNGSARFGLVIDEELNLAYVGNMDRGIEALKLGNPEVRIVSDIDNDGIFEDVEGICPSGISPDDNPSKLPDTIYVMAFLPGGAGSSVKGEVWSVNNEDEPIISWSDKVKSYIDDLVLTRQSENPEDEKFNLYISEPILVTVRPDEERQIGGKKILSGDWIRANLSRDLTQVLRYLKPEDFLTTFDKKKSIRAELIDSDKPNPVNNPSTGSGEVSFTGAGLMGEAYSSLYLHSGEFFIEEVDLRIPGRGIDFEFRRKYESQSIYSGVIGFGWEHNYNKRLLELPNGDILYFDGSGRRERYRVKKSADGRVIGYESPTGYFTEMVRRQDGFWTVKDSEGTVEFFDSSGRIVRIQDRNQNRIELYYDLSGRLSAIMDTMGRIITFDYYPYQKGDAKSGRLKELRDFAGRVVSYEYDENGRLIEANFEGRSRRYFYSESSITNLKLSTNISSITDPNGKKYLELSYDSEDKLTSQKLGGIPITINAGQTATTTDGNGNSRTYTHNESGNPVSITEGGFTTTYTYNTDGLITSITYPLGNKVEFSYDSSNPQRRSQSNLLSIKRIPDSRGGETLQTSFTYEPFTNQIVSIAYPKGNNVEFNLDERGNVVLARYPEGINYQYQYNKFGQLIKEIEPNGSVTEYEYYPESSPSGSQASSGGRALDPEIGGYLRSVEQNSYTYDIRGNLLSVEREDGIKVSYEVGRRNEVLKELSGGIERVYSYDGNGNITQIQELRPEAEKTINLSYNLFNNLVSIEESSGTLSRQIFLTYDGNQNIVKIETPTRSLSFKYDSRNLKTEEIRGKGGEVSRRVFEYDSNGNLTKLIDPRGKVKQFLYNGVDELKGAIYPGGLKEIYELDQSGRLISLKKLSSEENLLSETRYRYDPLGRMVGKIERLLEQNKDAITSYEYDKDGNLTAIIDPLGRKETMSYDSKGRMIKRVDPEGNTIEWLYDGRGNMVEIIEKEIGEGITATYREKREYDSLNRITKIIDLSEVRFSYDSLNRAIEEIQNGKKVTRSYNLAGELLSIQYPDGRIIEFERDGLGRIKRIKEGAKNIVTLNYMGPSRLLKKEYGNGIKEENGYDGGRRLTELLIKGSNGGSIQEFKYGWNSMNMRKYERRMPENLTDTYLYDSVYRLIEARIGMREPSNPQSFRLRKQYILDLVDNIQKLIEEEGGNLKEISTEVNNLNQYVRFENLALRYDRRGNLTEKGGKKFEYDWANRLISVEEGGKKIEFRYDALGRRIAKELNDQLLKSYYYDGWNVIEERDASDRVKSQYVYSGLDQPVEMTKYTDGQTKTYYPHQNSIGSVVFITDETGRIVEKVEYEPYGKPRFLIPTGNPENPYQIQEESTIGNVYLFQGREYDSETGLYNFRMRYYDPELGRFLSRDPSGYEDSMNLYQAFRLNPINFVDPMGLATFKIMTKIHFCPPSGEALKGKGWGKTFPPFEEHKSYEENWRNILTVKSECKLRKDNRWYLSIDATYRLHIYILDPNSLKWAYDPDAILFQKNPINVLRHEFKHVYDIYSYVKERLEEMEKVSYHALEICEQKRNNIFNEIRNLIIEAHFKSEKRRDDILRFYWLYEVLINWIEGYLRMKGIPSLPLIYHEMNLEDERD